MTQKKIPVRMCAGCRTGKPKKELIRVVRDPEGNISVDPTGRKNGRGAYVCRDAGCLAKARKMKSFERVFECAIPAEVYERLLAEMEETVN